MFKKISVIAIALLIVIGSVVAYFACDIKGLTGDDTQYNLVIEPSDFAYQISEKLEQNGIISNNTLWVKWMQKNYPDFVYINGEYNLNATMSYEEIARKLQNPDISHRLVKVAIPEGFNVFDIAQCLEENNICPATEFLNACKNKGDYNSYDWLKDFPTNDLIAYQLEGFLFPATYDFGENSDAHHIVDTMLDTFDSKISNEMLAFCKNNDMTLYELITLASIVQEEALTEKSAGNIASVFVNRLDKGIKLQSDVTYFYAAALRDEYGFSQQVYDSYYTYRCNGLPSGPVTNPGMQVINATINHPDTEYMYFFSDLNQDFHFAKDYSTFVDLQQKYPWK